MSKVLVYVHPPEGMHKPEVVFEGSRRHSLVMPIRGLDEDRSYTEHELFEVPEVDVEAAVEQLTKTFPSRDVGVYRLEKLAVRPPSEMVIRNVTKDGVLP